MLITNLSKLGCFSFKNGILMGAKKKNIGIERESDGPG